MFLAIATAAYGKSYDVSLVQAVKMGKANLKPGNYSLTIKDDTAVLRSSGSETFTVRIKLETGKIKFQSTAFDILGDEVKAIQLGGTTTTVVIVE